MSRPEPRHAQDKDRLLRTAQALAILKDSDLIGRDEGRRFLNEKEGFDLALPDELAPTPVAAPIDPLPVPTIPVPTVEMPDGGLSAYDPDADEITEESPDDD